jgi:peptidoglycan/LPS O-acetylase OafA/YrhL
MNLDDVMDAWRSQDATALHGVDQTLLHAALRQEQAKLQKQRRIDRWFIYVMSVLIVAAMGLFLGMMIYPGDDVVLTVWDYLIPLVGATAALVLGSVMYVNRRAQAASERGFGDSFRDQLRRRIAQLDDQATRERRLVLVMVTATLICGMAIYLAARRVNGVAYSDDWPVVLGLMFLVAVVSGHRRRRRSVEQDILPRQRRLEALLKELDG